VIGGIAFETPPSLEGYHAVPDNAVFTLAADRTAALSPQEGEADPYALHFDEQLRGLSVGAPVNFMGLQVGEVTAIRLEFDPATESVGTRVEIVAFPYRFLRDMKRAGPYAKKELPPGRRRELMQRQVVGKGLRAQLRSGSLLSGQLYVALDYFPDASQAMIDWSGKPPRFPTVPGETTVLRATLSSILAKIDNVPITEIGDGTRDAIRSIDRTLRLLEGETLPEAKKTFATFDRTLSRVDSEILPEARKALEELRKAAASAERALANADEMLLAPDAAGRQELLDALRETARAAQAVRLLADSLERNPSAVIRGRNPEKPR
jgi:paraquat-inducible protein B